MERRGSKGGKTTVKKHGRSHMAEIGSKGFATTVARHFGGDRRAYIDYLHSRAHEAVMEGFVDREIARRLDQGEQTVCYELPQITDPDDEIPW